MGWVMTFGKFNYEKLDDFEQVCLCYIFSQIFINDENISKKFLSKKMWIKTYNGLISLNENGKKFLNYCKKNDYIFKANNCRFNYENITEALCLVSKNCTKCSNIKKFYYYTNLPKEESIKNGFLEYYNKNFITLTNSGLEYMLKKCAEKTEIFASINRLKNFCEEQDCYLVICKTKYDDKYR